jgi:hypothetical protein
MIRTWVVVGAVVALFGIAGLDALLSSDGYTTAPAPTASTTTTGGSTTTPVTEPPPGDEAPPAPEPPASEVPPAPEPPASEVPPAPEPPLESPPPCARRQFAVSIQGRRVATIVVRNVGRFASALRRGWKSGSRLGIEGAARPGCG